MQAKTGPRLYSGPMQGGSKGQRAGDIRGAGSWMVQLITLLVCQGSGQGTWIPEQWPMAWRDGQRPARRKAGPSGQSRSGEEAGGRAPSVKGFVPQVRPTDSIHHSPKPTSLPIGLPRAGHVA